MAKAIPRALLIHSAVKRTGEKSVDRDGIESWPGSIDLTRIRVEPTNKLALDKDNRQVQLALLVFYDCQNSLPAGTSFTVGDAISYSGTEYTVVTVEPIFDATKLHHWELGLI